jgi:ABC-type Mn2+/Zn2+ transport system permease subunit
MSYQIILTLISGICISGVAGYLGTLMLSKKMSVVAGPLAHLAFPGVALALIFGFNISFGVFPFVILGAIFIWLLEKRTKLPMENLAAVIFAIGVGTALLFLPIGKAEEALVGSIDKITFGETIAVVSLSIFIFFVVKKLYQKMMLINIDENLAIREGINVRKYNLFYLLSIAIVIALSVYLVGGLITAALVAIPAATAKNVSRDLQSYIKFAIFFGIISAVTGIAIAHFSHFPIGPMVIVTNAVLFLISVIFMKKVIAS